MVTGGTQAARQTASSSKFCATLDFSRWSRMHGSRPVLFQLRQLLLAAVITVGAIAIITGVALCSGISGFSQPALAQSHD